GAGGAPSGSTGNAPTATTSTCTSSSGSTVAPTGFSFNPSTSTQCAGTTFSVQIVLNSSSQQVDGAQIRVTYDKRLLDVPGCVIADGTALGATLESRCDSVDSSTGLIRFAAGQLAAPFPNGTFTVATITFKALGVTGSGGTPLAFVISGNSASVTQATFNGQL